MSELEQPNATATVENSVEAVRERIIEGISQVFDPEIPVNIYELGLIYKIDIDPDSRDVMVEMTLTSPHCPAAQSLPAEVQAKVESVPGVAKVQLEIVWEPTWDQSMMSETAQFELGLI